MGQKEIFRVGRAETLWDKRRSSELGEQIYTVGRKEKFRVIHCGTKVEVLELGEQRPGQGHNIQGTLCSIVATSKNFQLGTHRSGTHQPCILGRLDKLGTKGKVLELGERRHCGTKGEIYSWESRDIRDTRRSFGVGRAEILGTQDEVLELGEQRYKGQKTRF